MAPHSSTLAWKIPWAAEPGRLQSMGLLRFGHGWVTSISLSLSLFTFMHWRRKWQPTPVLLPGESHGQRSLVGCSPWGHWVGHDRATSLSLFTFLHWRRKWQPTPVFLSGESHGQRSLAVAIFTPGDLPNPGTKPTSLESPALAGRIFTTGPSGKPSGYMYSNSYKWFTLLHTWN